MPTNRRMKKRVEVTEQPQQYQHRVEIAILALDHATTGIRTLIRFLLEQQGGDWRDLRQLDAAESDLKEALRCLRNRTIVGQRLRRRQR